LLNKLILKKKMKPTIKSSGALSNREKEVLYYSSVGKTYKEVAMMLGIKVPTVKFHMGNIVKKLNVLNSRQAIAQGIKLKIIDIPFVAADSEHCHAL